MSRSITILLLAAFCLTSVLGSFPHFSQGDARWKNQILGHGPATIGQAGCLMTSVTSLCAGLGIHVNGGTPNPSTMNNWLKAHGGFVSGDLFVWGSVASLGLHYVGHVTSHSQIVSALKQGRHVILNVNGGHHWVLATGHTSTGYTVMDPGYARSSYKTSEVVGAGVFRHGK